MALRYRTAWEGVKERIEIVAYITAAPCCGQDHRAVLAWCTLQDWPRIQRTWDDMQGYLAQLAAQWVEKHANPGLKHEPDLLVVGWNFGRN